MTTAEHAAPDAASDVCAVVVTYNSASTIDACLRSLLLQPELVALQVVDNGSRDDTVARVYQWATQDPRVRLMAQPNNPGFAAGCNAGAEVSREAWLLFANPDVVLSDDALARLLSHALATPALGALGADLRDADGARDPAARRHDLSLSRMLRAQGARNGLSLPVDEGQAVQRVDACSGALMLVSHHAFEAVHGWDAGYRLHVEDLDFCRRLRQAGFAVAVANDVAVLHERGVSSRSRPFFVEWHKHRGLWRYWWRFRPRAGTASVVALALAPAVLAALAARLLLMAWPKAAWRVLRSTPSRIVSGSG
jgi:GT2 family glycosyltransferase